ncbi:MAG: AAA family ATPase [Xanthobacteraceae bacterium]|nr:AAA family ATPase [Xanthobacteraceae bacterium]
MLQTLAVSDYRSIRNLVVPLAPLTVVTGPNGSGKSSMYRALRLLADTARGNLVNSLAREGGLPSTFWAGPEKIGAAMRSGKHPVQGTVRSEAQQLRLGFNADDFGYAIDLGYPSGGGSSSFSLDPEIKREVIWSGPVLRPASLMIDRRGPLLRAVSESGAWETVSNQLSGFESMMTEFSDPRSAPEMITVREMIRSWRFYDHFRTDAAAPCRQPQLGTYTPVLDDDGTDLGAALQTIREIGDDVGLDAAIEDAFPGSSVGVDTHAGRFEVVMRQNGLLRPLKAAELSDGTIRYLLLTAALLTPRPPGLMVLNEPETSLHPDLIPALARLIEGAARRSQVIVVSHSGRLVEALRKGRDARFIELRKEFGETSVADAKLIDRPRWEWPTR